VSLAIAVLSLTRDRLDYTKHSFDTLRSSPAATSTHLRPRPGIGGRDAGLAQDYDPTGLVLERENIGVCRGLNTLLDFAFEIDDYDVVVKFDNDCELTQPNTLRDVAPWSMRAAACSRRGSWAAAAAPTDARTADR
jgi:hypothetical protein